MYRRGVGAAGRVGNTTVGALPVHLCVVRAQHPMSPVIETLASEGMEHRAPTPGPRGGRQDNRHLDEQRRAR